MPFDDTTDRAATLLTTAATLQTLLDHLPTVGTLTAPQARQIAGGLRTFAQALGRRPDAVPLRPRDLLTALGTLNAAAADVSEARWYHVRSAVKRGLEVARTGGLTARIRACDALSPAWSALLASASPMHQLALGQFVRFADARGVAPDAVDDALVADWRAWRTGEGQGLAKDPHKAVGKAVSAWNVCARTVAGWPSVVLSAGPGRRPRFALRLADMPEGFRDEWAAFVRRFGPLDATPDPEPSARKKRFSQALLNVGTEDMPRLAATTLQTRLETLLLAAGTLVSSGEARLEVLTGLASVANPKAACLAADAILERLGERSSEYLLTFVKNLYNVQRRWCGIALEDEAAWAELFDEAEDLAPDRTTLTARNQRLVDDLLLKHNFVRLVSLPQQVMADLEAHRAARAGTATPVTTEMALDAYVAVAVGLLLVLPVRRANLVRLRFGTNLTLPARDDMTGRLYFSEDEVKNRRPLLAEVGPELVRLVRLYRDHYRPVLCDRHADNPYLMPAERGLGHRTLTTVADQVRDRVHKFTGRRFHVHLYRHLIAMALLRENPENEPTVQALLGHAPGSRATRRYGVVRTAQAAAYVEKILAAHRVSPSRRRRRLTAKRP
jgi:hypothetical protein